MKRFLFLLCSVSVLISCQREVPQNWVRPAAQGATTGAYLSYMNTLGGPDTLLKIHSDAAGMVQLHESYLTEDRLSGMREVKVPTLSPGTALVLKPGGKHLMLMDLQRELIPGDSLEITLVFSRAGSVQVQLPVLANH